MRIYARTDSNQQQIIDELRAIGVSVRPTHQVGSGFPDLVVGFRGVTLLVEVKTPTGRLTPEQIFFFDDWRGAAMVAETAEDVLHELEALTT